MSFWNDDTKVKDDFTPEDKYFYLYLLTNPHTNLAGCYEISLKTMSDETGYSKDTIERLLDRFEKVHEVIKYSSKTKEVYLNNWCKHNWTSSEKLDKPLLAQIKSIKNENFKAELVELYNSRDTVSIPYQYGIDTSIPIPIINNNTNINNSIINNKDTNNKELIIEIIDYLNNICGTKYTYKSKETIKHIKARLDEGFTVDDFKTVIDKKAGEWLNDPKMSAYLRPTTLFAPSKFESYLNQPAKTSRADQVYNMVSDWLNQGGET